MRCSTKIFNWRCVSFFIVCIIILCKSDSRAQSLYFPPLTGDTWETVSPESLGWCTDSIETLYDLLADENTKAFIVLKDGKIVLEKYFGTFVQDSLWYWASAGKTITAFLAGIAQQEGYLQIEDPTSLYLGDGWTNCTIEQENNITIWNQLTMTSGLDDGVPDNHCTIDTCLIYLAEPGTRWAYHNAPYTLLDPVLENATGTDLNIYTYQKLKLKTGMDGFWLPLDYNNVYFSTARSMARFGLIIQNDGAWNTDVLMNDADYFNQMINTSQELNKSYGYLWWLNGKESFMLPGLQLVFPGSYAPDAPDDMIAGLGKNGQMVSISEALGIVMVRMGNAPESYGDVPAVLCNDIWKKLNAIMCSATSNDEISIDVEVQLYPIPASNYFILEIPENIFDVEVLNAQGSVVFFANDVMHNIVVTTGAFSAGVYFIRITLNAGEVINRKIILE